MKRQNQYSNHHLLSPCGSAYLTDKDKLELIRASKNTYQPLRTCPCCGKGLMVFIVTKPESRVTVGCKDCNVFEDKNGTLKNYVGEVTIS